MENCIFCKIIKGEIPCVKIWEDKNYLAFLDVNPVSEGHALLIPKKHTDYLFDINDLEYSDLFLKAKELAVLLKSKIQPKKVGIVVEGFGVAHAHIHLVPINHAGELDSINAKKASAEELQKVAEKIFSKA
jgi:histidine triad (HIT) family protein